MALDQPDLPGEIPCKPRSEDECAGWDDNTGGANSLRTPTIVDLRVLLKSFQSTWGRALKGLEELAHQFRYRRPSYRSVALEEHGRQFMAKERLAWYKMEEKRAANEVAELAANKEAARQHAALANTLEAE
jgi:hypothetical protein